MVQMIIRVQDNTEQSELTVARICAELCKQGVNFEAEQTKGGDWIIRLTGGF